MTHGGRLDIKQTMKDHNAQYVDFNEVGVEAQLDVFDAADVTHRAERIFRPSYPSPGYEDGQDGSGCFFVSETT